MFAFQVATVVVVEEESNNQGQRIKYHGSILGHNIINRNRKEGELRLYNDYFAENPKFTKRRKDVEPAFGVLQSRFAIVHGSVRYWDEKNASKCYESLHNNA